MVLSGRVGGLSSIIIIISGHVLIYCQIAETIFIHNTLNIDIYACSINNSIFSQSRSNNGSIKYFTFFAGLPGAFIYKFISVEM